jgi:uncharacterized protein (TIGR02145 family)
MKKAKNLLACLLASMALLSCNKKEMLLPDVVVDTILYISHNSAVINCSIVDEGESTPVYVGIFLSEKAGVSSSDSIVKVTQATLFSVPLSELEPAKTYYFSPFCEDYRGLVMGKEKSFTTKPVETFTDNRDNNVYNVIQLGNLKWMAENLRFDAGGGSVPFTSDNILKPEKFGFFYTYETAKNACPSGWRLPSDEDWLDLERTIGVPEEELLSPDRKSQAGNALKHAGSKYFLYSYNQGTNSSGFTALPAGSYNPENGNINNTGIAAYFWTSTIQNNIIVRQISSGSGVIYRLSENENAKIHYSVRCVKDVQ